MITQLVPHIYFPAAVLVLAAGISCSSQLGEEDQPSSPSPFASLEAIPSAGLTADAANVGSPIPVGMERFTGVTMTFEYPTGWFLGRSIRPYYNQDRGDENVTLHNFDPAIGPPEGLQPGWIKMDFSSFPLSVAPTPVIDPGYEELEINNPSGARFLLGRLKGVPWHIWGLAELGDYFFLVSVLMETDDPPLEIVEPILVSWTLRLPE